MWYRRKTTVPFFLPAAAARRPTERGAERIANAAPPIQEGISLKIVVIGAWAMGTLFGGKLALAGAEVDVYKRQT